MKKYPVISPSGKEYAVTVRDDSWGAVVTIYVKARGLFGHTKFKKVGGGSWDGRYNLREWEFNYVEIAMHAVQEFENDIAEERYEAHLRKAEAKKFEEWDGDAR